MSSAEMQTTSILLRERWKLHTQSGVEKSTIKIRGRKLFVDSHQVGEVVDSMYRSTLQALPSHYTARLYFKYTLILQLH